MNNADQAVTTGWKIPPADELHKKFVAAQLRKEDQVRQSPQYQEVVASINEQLERWVSVGIMGFARHQLPRSLTPQGLENEYLLRVIANDYECNGYESSVEDSWIGERPEGERGISINVSVPHAYIQGKPDA